MFIAAQHNAPGGGGSGLVPRSALVERIEREGVLGDLYAELRARAERYLRTQPPDLTLQPTALVHEACLKLFGKERLEGADRSHLLALGSSAMRSVLIDHVRRRGRAKRQAPGERVPVEDIHAAFEERAIDILALDEALRELAKFDPEMAQVVDLHFFAGVPFQDIAPNLGVPLRTLERRWAVTRAWLRAEIG